MGNGEVVRDPDAGVLKPHANVLTGGGGATVGAIVVEPQTVKPSFTTLLSEYHDMF